MLKVNVRSAFDYDSDAVSLETGIGPGEEPSKTQQQFLEDSDINTIVRRFGLTGALPNGVAIPQSGDFTGVSDFQTALNLVRDAEAAFLQVPAATRARFGHDPAALIAFVEDVGNREEAIKLGLIPKPAEVARDGTPVVAVVSRETP